MGAVDLRIVLVHGGGLEINAWHLRTDHEPKFHNGLRVTNAHTMEVVDMVFAGKINKSLVTEINMLGGTGVGLAGKDARLLTDQGPLRIESAVLGFVGDVALLREVIGAGCEDSEYH
ncbi:acetylglutamate kinase-like [Dioscorea cayenensis subsp. rotundata]|uniref:Acetylglutamate kinase-like n=1 Tax=Dioscorea cayennensis subsp. rotundata TaxID=55577 RepID=A0AB40CWE4_DIOCR|nr:acetylglutamate kinase-like [Dioscorea cayenensis subsp. rotundata]